MPQTKNMPCLHTHIIPVGTVVLTLDGALPVEFLTQGDRVVTRNGAQIVRSAAAHVTRLGPVGGLGAITLRSVRLVFDRAVVLYGATDDVFCDLQTV